MADDWKVRALNVIREIPPGEEFIVDRLWDSIERPEEARVAGVVMLYARREGLVEATERYELSSQPHCHQNPRRVWKRAA